MACVDSARVRGPRSPRDSPRPWYRGALPPRRPSPRHSSRPPLRPKFTGLVIDARKLKVVPALEPRLLDESGRVIHGAGVLSAESRKTAGVASYFHRMDEALKDPRVADKPLLIKGKKSDGSDI